MINRFVLLTGVTFLLLLGFTLSGKNYLVDGESNLLNAYQKTSGEKISLHTVDGTMPIISLSSTVANVLSFDAVQPIALERGISCSCSFNYGTCEVTMIWRNSQFLLIVGGHSKTYDAVDGSVSVLFRGGQLELNDGIPYFGEICAMRTTESATGVHPHMVNISVNGYKNCDFRFDFSSEDHAIETIFPLTEGSKDEAKSTDTSLWWIYAFFAALIIVIVVALCMVGWKCLKRKWSPSLPPMSYAEAVGNIDQLTDDEKERHFQDMRSKRDRWTIRAAGLGDADRSETSRNFLNEAANVHKKDAVKSYEGAGQFDKSSDKTLGGRKTKKNKT